MSEITEWATIEDIIQDAETPRELIIEYLDKNGKLVQTRIFYCELTGEESSVEEISALLDPETNKPKDVVAIIRYQEKVIIRRLCKASGKAVSWNFTPEKWDKLPETVRAQVRQKMGLADKERQDVFLHGLINQELPS
jgi:hypothetical protein